MFCAPGFAREIELDHVLDPLAVVGHRFEVARLLPALGHGESFYVLTVGAENVGMSVVNDFGWDACDVPDLPKSIEEGLWFEKIDRTSTTHGATRGEGGRRTIHHGKGAQNEDRKRRMGRFLRLVDDRVVAYLASASSPLIVTGTAPVVAMYEQVTRYANVVPVPIGSPEEITPSELHQKIDLVIDAEISHQNDQIVAHFASLMGTGRASGDLTELLSAAETGRVATVLVASTAPVWVRAGQPENVLPEWEEGSEDLVNRVVVEASRRGAEVRVVDSLPRELTVAGIFRH